MEKSNVTTTKNVVNHHERILDRILKLNFIGAVIVSKDILPSKMSLFDVTCDITREEIEECHDKFYMDYGDSIHEFDFFYTPRPSKSGTTEYIISNIS